MRFARFWLLILAFALVSCGKRESEAFASEAGDQALFELVLGKHAETREPVFLNLPESDVDQGGAGFCLQPNQVIRLSAEQAVLLVSGLHCDKEREDWGPAVVGAYWFQLREGKWFKASQPPAFRRFLRTGGLNVEIKLRALSSKGQTIIGVEYDDCGVCGSDIYHTWLELFLLSDGELRALVDSKPIMLSYLNRCWPEVESAAIGSKIFVGELEEYGGYPNGCFLVNAVWNLQPAAQGFGDLIIDFSGRKTSEPVEIKAPPATAVSDESTPAQDAASHPAQVTVEPVKGQQIFRFRNGHYQLLKGKNPAEGLQ